MAENTHFDLDVVMTRADSRTIPLEFYDDDDNELDLTLWDFFYTAKESVEDSDDDAVITLDPLDLVPYGTGPHQVDIPITEALSDIQAQSYEHDIQVMNPAGTMTIMKGNLIIEDQVTIRVAAMP